jgi:hypothetical protein
MFCTSCGNGIQSGNNFCSRCGAKVNAQQLTIFPAQPAVQQPESLKSKFWRRLKQAVIMQLQQQAMANAAAAPQGGDNFWSSATARGNDNGQSGYVSVDGITVGYDR